MVQAAGGGMLRACCGLGAWAPIGPPSAAFLDPRALSKTSNSDQFSASKAALNSSSQSPAPVRRPSPVQSPRLARHTQPQPSRHQRPASGTALPRPEKMEVGEATLQPAKPPLYRSKYPGAVSPKAVPCSNLGVKTIRTTATMGPGSGVVLVSPSKFLLAHEKEPVLPEPCKPSGQKLKLKEEVPKRSEKPLMGLQSGADFVSSNIKEAAGAAPKYKEQQQMDYLSKPWFGEVPPYLQQRMHEIEAQRLQVEDMQHAGEMQAQAQLDKRVVRTLHGEELATLVTGLKLKWQSLNEAYQKLPCVLDTPSSRRRKEDLETQLADIERDILVLQRAQIVKVTVD